MSMPATEGHSVACCNVPPIVSSGYVKRGTYRPLGGMRTYVTGQEGSKTGIVVVYDIFGYFDQTLQGADILAYGGEEGRRVFMPDWFGGSPVPIEYYPPDTREKKDALSNFFKKYPPAKIADKVPAYVDAIKAAEPSIDKFAIVGYCWGGKVASLLSRPPTPFSSSSAVHPAMLDPSDASQISIPHALLASKDEDPLAVSSFKQALDHAHIPNRVETFPDQVHGWMAARGDLANDHVKEEYERGYCILLDFFAKYL